MKTNYNTETLIPCEDYVLQCMENAPLKEYHEVSEEFMNKVIERSQFLKQTPKLGDFIPTNKKGEVLEEPEGYKRFISAYKKGKVYLKYPERMIEYQQAQERVKFEGWEFKEGFNEGVIIRNDSLGLTLNFLWDTLLERDTHEGFKTINTYSDLTGYGLKMIVR